MADVFTPIPVKTKTDGDVVVKLSDGTDIALVSGTGELLVQVNVALPTGGNTIGEVTIGLATTAATDLAKAEDAIHADGDVGVMALIVRNDVLAALAAADGDYGPLQVNAAGALYIQEGSALDVSGANVTVVGTGTFVVQEDGAALTALQLIDNPVQVLGTDTYLEATDSAFLIGVVRNDTLAALASVDNEIAPLQVNALGALYIQEGVAMDVSAATVTVDSELAAAAALAAAAFSLTKAAAALTAAASSLTKAAAALTAEALSLTKAAAALAAAASAEAVSASCTENLTNNPVGSTMIDLFAKGVPLMFVSKPGKVEVTKASDRLTTESICCDPIV